jgi:Tol biopolymer transport system component
VLYEMATGKKAFAGSSQASLIGSIMHSAPPPVSSLAPLAPPALDRVIATCLAKDPKDRWSTAHDLKLQLAWIAEGGSQIGVPAPVAARRKNREKLAWTMAALFAVAAVVAAAGYLRRAPVPARLVRFDVPQSEDVTFMGEPKMAPDGSAFAFVATDKQGKTEIWVRPLEALEAHVLPGTEGVVTSVRPFWSFDSKFLGYFVPGKLMKVPVDGGPPQKIADSPVEAGDGAWSPSGVILFDGGPNDPIHRVDAAGGVPRVEQAVGKGEHALEVAWPQFLPDGKHYLYINFGGAEAENGVRVAKLDGGPGKRIVGGLSRVEYAPPDYLLFVRESTLVAQRFDAASAKVLGEPVPVAEGLGISSIGLADFSASRNGTLIFRAGQNVSGHLAWFGLKDGKPIAGDDPGEGSSPGLSPDGRWLAVNRDEGKNQDIWLRDLKRGVSSRLTTDPKAEYAPLFTPDGKSIVFSRDEGKDGWALVERSLDSSAERVLVPPAMTELALAISPNGRTLLYGKRRIANGGPQFDLYATDLATGGEGRAYAATDFSEFGGSFSPDGKWLAYQSNESGRNEVYAQSFPDPGRKWQVSTQGGSEPMWSRDGATLYYRGPGNKLMQVAVKTSPGFDAGIPAEMYVLPIASVVARGHLDLAPDGERLLVTASSGDVLSTPTTVVLNWNAHLQR